MKKFVAVLLLVTLSITSLFSVTLTVWSSEKQQDFIRKVGQEFTRDTGVTVEVQQITFGDIKTKFLTAAQAGEGPDIIIGAQDWLGELVVNGLLEPIPRSALELDKFAESGIQAFTYEGVLYGVPYAIESQALFYNRDYISDDEVPTNINDLKRIAKQFTTPDTAGFLFFCRRIILFLRFNFGLGRICI